MSGLHITQVVLSGQSAGSTPAGVALMNYMGPEDGYDGLPGQRGADGAAGAAGSIGPAGPAIYLTAQDGEDGQDGIPGQRGVDGAQGATGDQGPAGPAIYLTAQDGEDGQDGIPGQRGADGAQGATGDQGPAGPAIFMLAQDGEDGQDGIPGQRGVDGAQGATGDQGPPGPALFMMAQDGEDGEYGPPGPKLSPGGDNTQVQFNAAGFLDGSLFFIWDDTNWRSRIGDVNHPTPQAQLHIADFMGIPSLILETAVDGLELPKMIFRKTNSTYGPPTSGGDLATILVQAMGDTDYLDAAKITVLPQGDPSVDTAICDMNFWIGYGPGFPSLFAQMTLSSIGNTIRRGCKVVSGLYQPYNSGESWSIPTENAMVMTKRVTLLSGVRLTLTGTARLRLT